MIGNMVQDECEGALERSSPRLSLVLQQSMVGAAALPPGRDREGSKGEGGGRKKKRRSQTDLFYPLCFSPLRPYCSLRTGGENGIAEAPLLLQPYLLEGFRRDPASTDGGGGGGGRQTAVLLLRPTESERPRAWLYKASLSLCRSGMVGRRRRERDSWFRRGGDSREEASPKSLEERPPRGSFPFLQRQLPKVPLLQRRRRRPPLPSPL